MKEKCTRIVATLQFKYFNFFSVILHEKVKVKFGTDLLRRSAHYVGNKQ